MMFLKWYSIIFILFSLIVYVYAQLQEEEFGKAFFGAIILLPVLLNLILN